MKPIQSAVVTEPGLYAMSPSAYHADTAPHPSLSCSLIKTLLSDSPAHAWTEHPRLNPVRTERDGSKASDLGSVIHKLTLGAGEEIMVIDADSYRTKAAQEARDEAYATGRLPCLTEQYHRAQNVAVPFRDAIEAYIGGSVMDCYREVACFWQEGGYWRRALFDLLTPDLLTPIDLKSTQTSVNPHSLRRFIYSENYHIQAAWYLRGLDAIDPANKGRRQFPFVFCEQKEPHLISPPMIVSEAGMQMARAQVDVACALWDSCLSRNEWPGYGSDPVIAEPPNYILSQWAERYESDETLNAQEPSKVPNWKQHMDNLYGRKE